MKTVQSTAARFSENGCESAVRRSGLYLNLLLMEKQAKNNPEVDKLIAVGYPFFKPVREKSSFPAARYREPPRVERRCVRRM
jgi:hypothetical protein